MSPRTALVTGGTRGIGAATSTSLAALGVRVVATYRSDAAGAAALAERVSDDSPGSVEVLRYDLAAAAGEDGSVEALVGALRDRGADVDILVVNAAAPYPKVGLAELSADTLTRKMAADVGSAHRLVVALAPAMAARGFGRIVLVGSLHSLGPTAPGMAANGVTKAALAAYVTFAVDELTGPGVTVNLVEPGFVETDASAQLPRSVASALSALTPSARAGEPADIAAAITWLTQDAAGFVNGARIPVAGGLNTPVAVTRVLRAQGADDA